ncbi:glycosyltransferase [Mycobacterium phage ScoobyDoobyDoo]|nr:glycosyltransferase [Mycobacterium phage ScoobyDoobyDoo]
MSHIAVAVVAHPDRQRDMAPALREVADRCFIDDGRLGAGRNHLRAWRYLARQDSEWGVVLEDDALPVDGFSEQLTKALRVAPTPVVSLYLGRTRPPHRQHSINRALGMISVDGVDPHWLVSPYLLHHVGVAIHTDQIESLIEYMPWHLRTQTPPDEILSRWVQRGPKCQVSYTWPSLVDHNDELPSVITSRTTTLVDGMLAELYGVPDERDKDDPRLKRVAWRTGTRETWNSLSFPF